MSDETPKQESSAKQADGAARCGPGCDCGQGGLSAKGKAIICLIVAIVAAAFLIRGFVRGAHSADAQGSKAFATTVPVSPSATGKAGAIDTNQARSAQWGNPLRGLASLNEVAADKAAVFVYLPEKGKQPSEAVKRSIEQAAAKSGAKGMGTSFYTLDTSSKDYAQVTAQSSAPCVMALVKNASMKMVSGDISEKKLLEALVAASRTSSCGPSGCGPSGCK